MKLDHLSYVTPGDQLAATVQRIGSLIGTSFRDGGVHPGFGTRNFTAVLKNGLYFEIVCPLNHPATESTPWGKAVLKKAKEGGGWLTWVFSVPDITKIESKFGRLSVPGHRLRPDGVDYRWKQIGVLEISEFPQLPFFIQWLSAEKPALAEAGVSEIISILVADDEKLRKSSFRNEIFQALRKLEIRWISELENGDERGIVAVECMTPQGKVYID